jgi:hypothetical protein
MTNWIIGEGQALGTYGTTTGNEAWLEYAVTNLGPVSVCLYVSNKFFSYTSGKFSLILKPFIKKRVLVLLPYKRCLHRINMYKNCVGCYESLCWSRRVIFVVST